MKKEKEKEEERKRKRWREREKKERGRERGKDFSSLPFRSREWGRCWDLESAAQKTTEVGRERRRERENFVSVCERRERKRRDSKRMERYLRREPQT